MGIVAGWGDERETETRKTTNNNIVRERKTSQQHCRREREREREEGERGEPQREKESPDGDGRRDVALRSSRKGQHYKGTKGVQIN